VKLTLGAVQEGVHGQLGEVRFKGEELGPWPDEQVARTVGRMRDKVHEDVEWPQFREWAKQVAGAGYGTPWEQAQRVYEHVKNGIKFQRDEVTAAQLVVGMGDVGDVDTDDVVEVIIRPVDMMGYVQQGCAVGDCDDFCMYLAALLKVIGVDCSFVTLAADDRAPGNYSHVYVAAYPEDGDRVAMDASHGPYMGWEAPDRFGKVKEWPVGEAWGDVVVRLGALAGVGALGWMVWKELVK
jgi:hypothetical protein